MDFGEGAAQTSPSLLPCEGSALFFSCLQIPHSIFSEAFDFIYSPLLAVSGDGRALCLLPVTSGLKCLFLSNAEQEKAELSCIPSSPPPPLLPLLPSVLNLFPCLAGFNLHFLTLSHLQSQPVLPAFPQSQGGALLWPWEGTMGLK